MWLQSCWLGCHARRVIITGSVGEIGSSLILFIIISELWNWHKGVVGWYIDVVRWHVGLFLWKSPEISEHFESFNFSKPSFCQECIVNFARIFFEAEFFKLAGSNDSLRLEFIVKSIASF
jgi:hypothetical protein